MPTDGSRRLSHVTSREQLPADDQHQYDELVESRGEVVGPFRVLLHSPEMAGRVGHLGQYLRFEGHLPGDVRELAILTVAREFDCAFEWAYHEPIAREEGLDDAVIEAINTEADLTGLDAAERGLVRYVRELIRDHTVSEDTYAAVAGRFADTAIVEFTATVGYYAMLACVLNAFEVLPTDDRPALR